MDKDSWIMILVIIASIVLMLIVQGCSLVNVQVATGSPSVIDDPFQKIETKIKEKQ